MFSGLTIQEQRVLLVLILLIGIGLGVNYVRSFQQESGVEILLANAEELNPQNAPGGSAIANPSQTETRNLSTNQSRIDINTAEAAVLTELYRIGPSRAQAIIDYRKTHGPFQNIEELKDVPGIGPKTFEGIRARVFVDSEVKALDRGNERTLPPAAQSSAFEAINRQSFHPSNSSSPRINLNSADENQLCQLNGIDHVLATRIIEHRRRYGPFRRIEDVMQVSGIKEKKLAQFRHQVTLFN